MTAHLAITAAHDWYIGDDFPMRFQVLDADGVAVDVSAWNCRFVLRRKADDPDELIEITNGSQLSVAAGSGYIDVDAADTDTDDLHPMTGVFSLKRTDSGAEETLVEGPATLKLAATSR